MPVRVYRFGEFALDCDRFELQRGTCVLKLERKPLELLILLAAKNGDLVTRAEIAERLWEPEVFVDTEHGINTAVRKIRQVLRDDSDEPRFVQTVTGKGYRFVGELKTEVIAERAPKQLEATASVPLPVLEDSVTPDAEVQQDVVVPARRVTSRARVWIGAACMVVFLIAGVVWMRLAERPAIHSLAMLPLENLTGDPSEDYVAVGVTDELITMLAKNSNLRITSRTSVMQYRGVHRPMREIAHELNVDALLEGSISRVGNKTHVTIQLIDGRNDTHLWAESYEQDAGGLVTFPLQASQAIARRLNSSVASPTVSRTVSPEAHDAYMRGRYLWFTDHTREAGPYFKHAIELQPDYALGWAGLGIYYGASAVKGELSPAASLPELKQAASRALALDDSLPEAHLAAAGEAMAAQWDLHQAEFETQRATNLDPKFAEAYHLRAKILGALNRHPEAIEAQRTGSEIDPFSRPWALALALREARRFDDALKEGNDEVLVYPNNPILLGIISSVYDRKGMQKEAIEMLARSLAAGGHASQAESVKKAFEAGGYKAVLERQLADAKERSQTTYVPPMTIARLEAQLGHREEALSMIEAAVQEHSPGVLWIQNEPAFDWLHGEERYRTAVKQIGLPPVY